MQLTAADILNATQGDLITGSPETVIRSLSIDSRTAGQGALFVPLQGTRSDGHLFIRDALAAGAAGALIRARHELLPELRSRWADRLLVGVSDPLQGLGAIAGCWRERCRATVVAITGSNGKTSSKEMAYAIVAARQACMRNPGNYNNLIGLPLSLQELEPGHAAAILEMGMSEPGEIRRLCEISKPQIGLITNIGPSHLEQLKTLEAIAAAKAELFESLGPEATAIINADDPRVTGLARRTRARQVSYGMSGGDVTAARIGSANGYGTVFDLRIREHTVPVRLQVPGAHFVSNALAAAAVADTLGIGIDSIGQGLAAFTGVPGRMETLSVRGLRIINDAYNANPVSMQGALQVLAALPGAGRRIAVLGDMLELGSQSVQFHRELGRIVAGLPIDYLFVTGEFSSATQDGACAGGMPAGRIVSCADVGGLAAALQGIVREGDAVLLKGSRRMRMERVIELLQRDNGRSPAV